MYMCWTVIIKCFFNFNLAFYQFDEIWQAQHDKSNSHYMYKAPHKKMLIRSDGRLSQVTARAKTDVQVCLLIFRFDLPSFLPHHLSFPKSSRWYLLPSVNLLFNRFPQAQVTRVSPTDESLTLGLALRNIVAVTAYQNVQEWMKWKINNPSDKVIWVPDDSHLFLSDNVLLDTDIDADAI